jgi:hypothetical protein
MTFEYFASGKVGSILGIKEATNGRDDYLGVIIELRSRSLSRSAARIANFDMIELLIGIPFTFVYLLVESEMRTKFILGDEFLPVTVNFMAVNEFLLPVGVWI